MLSLPCRVQTQRTTLIRRQQSRPKTSSPTLHPGFSTLRPWVSGLRACSSPRGSVSSSACPRASWPALCLDTRSLWMLTHVSGSAWLSLCCWPSPSPDLGPQTLPPLIQVPSQSQGSRGGSRSPWRPVPSIPTLLWDPDRWAVLPLSLLGTELLCQRTCTSG